LIAKIEGLSAGLLDDIDNFLYRGYGLHGFILSSNRFKILPQLGYEPIGSFRFYAIAQIYRKQNRIGLYTLVQMDRHWFFPERECLIISLGQSPLSLTWPKEPGLDTE
jgi:hypothetical protein